MRRRDVLGVIAGAAGAALLGGGGAMAAGAGAMHRDNDHPPDPVERRGDAGDRARHLAGVRCRRRRSGAAEAGRGVAAAGRCRRPHDRHLADVRPRRSRDRRSRRRAGLRPRVFLATKVWTSGRDAGHRADAALGRIAAEPGPRPDPDPQPARLAHPSRHAAADEGRRAGPLYRHHALHDRVAVRAGAHSRNRARHRFRAVRLFARNPRRRDPAAAGRRRARGRGHRQPAVRDRRHVPQGARRAPAGMGGRVRLRELGAAVPEIS